MNKSKVTIIGISIVSIFILLFFINDKYIQEYKYASSYFLNQSMNSMNDAALNIINHVDGSHEFTVRELLDIYEEEAKLIETYADISYSLKLEENSKILNPSKLYMLVPLNNTEWWSKKEDKELVVLNETEYNSINNLLNLSKIVSITFKDLDITYVEETTPSIATKLLSAITKEYPY
ncbi:hypothetical protein [Paenibacillus lemnae]|uniref:Uncharacterized protein n=1 Tax=Paenibacillus lemnae TaxID=1330551 RepID=A0A848MBS6_PAELE|nr:hypothetical protein [Paenibacillus lemnae]NMO97631.1 hypothetical protein [Paenibacillus lemnae]